MTILPSEAASRIPPTTTQTRVNADSRTQLFIDYLVFTLCTSLYLIPFMRLLLLGTDEGLFISGAVRVVQGQVFARDFFEIVGPGTFYWLALFFKMFGVTFTAAHTCLFVTSLGTGLLMYFLSRQVCVRYRTLPSIIVCATSFGMIWPTVSHHVNSNFFALATVASAVVWRNNRRAILLSFAGILAGVTTAFHLPKGVFLLLALLAWLWTEHRQRRMSLSTFAWLIAGYGSVIGSISIYFWREHALWDLYNANYLFPSQHYGAVNTVPYALGIFGYYWKSWVGATSGFSWTLLMGVILVIPLLLIAILPAVLPLLGWKRRSWARSEITLYWLCGCALWLAEYHRKDIWHLVVGSPLLIILFVAYLEVNERWASVALQTISISTVFLALFNLLLALSAHPMMTQVGSVAIFGQDRVVAELDRRATPGEEIFVYPSDAIYYFLSGTKNPIRFSGLMYDYNSDSDFADAVSILDQHRVKYVLWDAGYIDRVQKLYFPSAKPARRAQLIIEPYLESHYKTIWSEGETRLLERKIEDNLSSINVSEDQGQYAYAH